MPFDLASELTEHGARFPGSALAASGVTAPNSNPRAATAAIDFFLKPNLQARRLTTDAETTALPPAFSLNSEVLR
jgi:hypothetical protein